MRGHQQSNTRKLNRHWQSGNRGINVFNDPSFVRTERFSVSKKSNDTIYLNNVTIMSSPYSFIPNVYDNPVGFFKVPDNKKIKLFIYGEIKQASTPNTLHIGYTNLSNAINDPVICRITMRKQNSTADYYHTLLLSECTDKKNITLMNSLKNTEDDTYSGVYPAYIISNKQSKPTTLEFDISTFLSDVYEYRIDIFPTPSVYSHYTLYYETAPKGLRYDDPYPLKTYIDLYFTTTPRII